MQACLGSHKHDAIARAREGALDILLTSYETLNSAHQQLFAIKWEFVLFDGRALITPFVILSDIMT